MISAKMENGSIAECEEEERGIFGVSTCVKCHSGYFLMRDATQLKCGMCPLNCATCTSLRTCLTCSAGHYLHRYTDHSECQKCSQNCLACEGYGNCTICDENYVADGSVCRLKTCAESLEGCVFTKGNPPECKCVSLPAVVFFMVYVVVHLLVFLGMYFRYLWTLWRKAKLLRNESSAAEAQISSADAQALERKMSQLRQDCGLSTLEQQENTQEQIKNALQNILGSDFDPPPLYQQDA